MNQLIFSLDNLTTLTDMALGETLNTLKSGSTAICNLTNGEDVYVCIEVDPSNANLNTPNDTDEEVIQKVFVSNSSNNDLQSKERNVSE